MAGVARGKPIEREGRRMASKALPAAEASRRPAMSDIVGIDLGTTNSALAVIGDDGQPRILASAEGRNVTPSVVHIASDGKLTVGEAAVAELPFDAPSTARLFKRDMENDVAFEYHGRKYTPVDLSAAVLAKLKQDAETALGRPIQRAVVTVPAYFHDVGRVATSRAAQQAGLEVVQIINEPTAAALAFGLRGSDTPRTVLVYDLGGGTFDVTLVRLHGETIDVIGTDGNHTLGGKDWDDRLVTYAAEQVSARSGYDALTDPADLQVLYAEAERAKKDLSVRLAATMSFAFRGERLLVDVTREQFESLTADLLIQTEQLIERVLDETNTSIRALDTVLLVGGSTRMPACHALVERLTGSAPNRSVNPDECVALGAAVCGALYQEPAKRPRALPPMRVNDVMSHSLGMIAVSADGDRYVNTILLPRNERIPCNASRPYRVNEPGGTVSIYVTQGENDNPLDCSFVGKFVIDRNDGAADLIDVSYAYDRSGIVDVQATVHGRDVRLPVRKERMPEDMSWLTGKPGRKTATAPRTVFLAIDLSGSMAGNPLRDAKDAMSNFVDGSDLTTTAVGLISFANSVTVNSDAVRDAKKIHRAIEKLSIGPIGYGNSAHPFDDARKELKNAKGMRFLVVLTDGAWACQSDAIQASKRCQKDGIQVIAIGFGTADEDFLRKIASADLSALFSSSADLGSAFEQIAQVVLEGSGKLARR
jgi:molecular chaperone DnaK (HSP70)